MPQWKIIDEPVSYTGGADQSSDVSHGFKFTLEHETGRQTTVNVEAASGGPGMSAGAARDAVRAHLDDDEPPQRLVMDTDGRFN